MEFRQLCAPTVSGGFRHHKYDCSKDTSYRSPIKLQIRGFHLNLGIYSYCEEPLVGIIWEIRSFAGEYANSTRTQDNGKRLLNIRAATGCGCRGLEDDDATHVGERQHPRL